MLDWLDSWTNTRRLSQHELSGRWKDRVISQAKPKILPLEHTKKILQFGTKAYRKWEREGFPEDYIWERISG